MKYFSGIVTAVLLLTACASAPRPDASFADQMLESRQAGKPWLQLSQEEPAAGIDRAYQIQAELVQKISARDAIVGYKAGLTSTAGQKKFAVDESIAGVLFGRGSLPAGTTLPLNQFYNLMMETEIGFVLAKAVTEPVTDINELRSLVASMVPVIEFPDLAYYQPDAVTGPDLIASNAAAARYIVGKRVPLARVADPGSLTVRLSRGTSAINLGQGSDAMGDQWTALQWLINRSLASGYRLEAGHLLITGALGRMLPAQAGNYRADFGPLGTITFRIR